MPELPEVETYVRDLERLLAGRSVVRAEVRWPRTVAAPQVDEFVARMAGQRFSRFERRGKYMLLGLASGETLVVHLRMTGAFVLVPASGRLDSAVPAPASPAPASSTPASSTPALTIQHVASPDDPHVHLLFELDDGSQLRFRDTRKFGRLWLVEDVGAVVRKLGPEPWDDAFTPASLAAALAGRRAAVKALLLDQRVVAGVGNIYADESLWQAEILPMRPAGSLTADEAARLHAAIQAVLERAIARGGSSLGDGSTNYVAPSGAQGGFQEEFAVFQRTGKPCPRCGAPILRTVVAQRGTHYCGVCQG